MEQLLRHKSGFWVKYTSNSNSNSNIRVCKHKTQKNIYRYFRSSHVNADIPVIFGTVYRLSVAFGGKRKLRVQNVLEHPFPVRRAGMEFIHFNSNDPNRIVLTITYIFKKTISCALFVKAAASLVSGLCSTRWRTGPSS